MEALNSHLNDGELFKIISIAIKRHLANNYPERYLAKCNSIILCTLATKLTTPFQKGKPINDMLFNILQYSDTFTILEQLMAFIDQFKTIPTMFTDEYWHLQQLKKDNKVTEIDLVNSPTVHKFIKIMAMGKYFSNI